MEWEAHYQQLLSEWPALATEAKEDFACFKERHLQVMWLEQCYFSQLKTADGQEIEVVSPGIWNGEAGPDFVKAHLRIGGRDHLGDIEIHLADSSWYHHHHDSDARYDNVILHVSLWPSAKPMPLLKSNGEEVIKAYLEPYLTIPLKRIVQLIDLELYPYKKFVGSGRCAQTLFRSMAQGKVEAIFSSAGYWRLNRKSEFLEARVGEPGLRLAAGTAMALGYKANALAFFELFGLLYQQTVTSLDELLAVALGVSGFMESPFAERWQGSSKYQTLHTLWKPLQPILPTRISMVVGKSRPLNHPVRRLVALSHLVLDVQQGRWPHHSTRWEQQWRSCASQQDFVGMRNELLQLIPTYEDAYWHSHYLFETEPRSEFLTLIGQDLRQLILVNALLPLLYRDVVQRGDPEEMRAFDTLYRSFHAPHSGKRGYLHHRFFGDTPKGALFGRSLYEQGAFQIHRDFCVHFEASCEGCPFVERVQTRLLD